ncbi:MAG: S41 family peptidase [Bryobacteraceae bacterium]
MLLGARMLSTAVLLAASLCAQSPLANTGLGEGQPGETLEPARPLTPQGFDNLRALARLFGFVRYFHPSDEAATADWNRFAVAAVRAVEPAGTPAELAAKLESAFAPVAQQVRVVPVGAPRPEMDMQFGPFVALWQHRGLGPPQGKSPYISSRFLIPRAQALVQFAAFREDLPGGVSCMVPMALYRNQGPLAQARALPAPGGSPNDRATRLAAVIVAWNVFQHFYPYFEELGPVWMAALGPLLSEAARDKDAQAFHATLQKMAVILRDGHGYVSGPGAPPDYVPPVVWTMAEGRITALSVEGTVDVKPGDALISIDGKPAAEALAAREAGMPGSTAQCIRERGLTYLLAHAPGDKILVELEPAAQPGARRTVTLDCTIRTGDLYPPRPGKIAELEPGIFYLDLDRITDADFAAAVPALAKARGMVYDLRGDPNDKLQFRPFFGHLLDRAVQGPSIADPIVTRPDGAETMFQESQWLASPVPPYFPAKRAFLSGGRAIGYAETILSIVERYKLAEIVGEPSGGINGTVNSFTVPGGYELTWTGERVRKHDGSPLFGVGIRPTIPVSPTRAGIAAGRDEVLERGVQAVK